MKFDQNRFVLVLYHLAMVSFFLPPRINTWVMLLLGAVSLPYLVRCKKSDFRKEHVLSFASFGLLAIGYFYSDNQQEAGSILERSSAYVLAPLLAFSFQALSLKEKQNLLKTFVLSALLACLYCLGFASFAYFESGTAYPTGQTGHFVYNRFMHQRLSAALGMHAIYLSFYCALAAFAVFQQWLTTPMKTGRKLLLLLLLLFFTAMIYLLKSSLFAFVFPVSCLLLLFVHVKKRLKNPKHLVLFVALCLVVGSFSYKGVVAKLDTFNTSYQFTDESIRPLPMRLALWICAWEVVQENFWFGSGTGDGTEELQQEYESVGFQLAQEGNFNAHNMYLQYWISNGIFMVLLFVLFLFSLFVKAIKHHNFLLLAFTFYFTFFSITESTLLKQKGIVFFLFFAFLWVVDPNCWKPNTAKHS